VLGSGVYLWVAKRNVPIHERLRALQQRGGALSASAAMQAEKSA